MAVDERPPTANGLPPGWVLTTLGEVCLKPQYGWTTSAVSEGTLNLLRTTDITSGYIEWETVPFCKKDPPEKEKFLLRDGDIVVSRAGSVGYSHLVRNPPGEAIFASYLIRFKPLIDQSYVAFFLKSPFYWEAISEKSSGIAIPNVNATKLKQIRFPLAPFPEQRRIVAKIESLFSQSRRGQEALAAVPDLLTKFRQAVLAAAFRGDLTQRNTTDEPASVLLERIRVERRRRWEEGLRAQGKDPSRRKYKEPEPPDTSELPELSEGWCWVSLGQLLERIDAGRSPRNQGRPAKPGELGVLKVSAVTWGEFLPEENKALLPGDEPGDTPTVKANDLLISRANTTALVGAVVLVKQDYPNLMLSDKTLRLAPVSEEISPKYLLYALRAQWVRDYFASQATGTSNSMRNISQVKIRATPIVLPPLAEQRRIVARIEALFAQADVLEAQVAATRRRLEQVDQAILARAFRGELVEQDPADEPAEVLLERIRET